MERGFYKENNEQWYYANNKISGPNYELDINLKDAWSYPVDGWVYYETAPQGYLDYMQSLDDGLGDDFFDSIGDGNYYKIYDYLSMDTISQKNVRNKYITPHSLDYKKDVNTKLHPEYIFDELGFLVECNYYTDLSVSIDYNGFTVFNYSNQILKYVAVYELHDTGHVKKRTVTRSWYLKDGTISNNAKVTEKFYDGIRARDEGKRRRRNLINKLIIETVGLIILTSADLSGILEAESDAMPFMKDISSGISDYYEYGNKKDSQKSNVLLVEKVLNSTYSRLDNFVPKTNDKVTIRDYIVSKINI